MRFENVTLHAIRFRAQFTGAALMTVEDIALDLGYPMDFDDVLANLHARGLITLHGDSDALTLMDRGRREEFSPSHVRRRAH